MSLARIELMTSRELKKALSVQNHHSTIVTMYGHGNLSLIWCPYAFGAGSPGGYGEAMEGHIWLGVVVGGSSANTFEAWSPGGYGEAMEGVYTSQNFV